MRFITPNYLKNFRCDGALCESYCCKNWKIAIDENAKQRYEDLSQNNREKILSYITEKEGNFYFLKMKNDGSCPFLREDFLCDLQKTLGEDYLSDICYSYPRMTTKIKDAVFQSLTLSCPLAAEIVLFSSKITFIESEILPSRLGWNVDIEKRAPIFNESVEDMLSAGLFILKENDFSIKNRLKMLLNFYIAADKFIDNNNELDKLLISVENGAFQNEFLNKTFHFEENNIFKKEEFLNLIRELFDLIYDANITDEKYDALRKIYNDNIQNFEEFVNNNSQIFTNYLMNEFFMRVYPYAFNENFATNVKIFILSWYALYFALFMLYVENGLTKERLIFGVRRLVEKIDHGQGIMKKIITLAKKIPTDE